MKFDVITIYEGGDEVTWAHNMTIYGVARVVEEALSRKALGRLEFHSLRIAPVDTAPTPTHSCAAEGRDAPPGYASQL